MCSTDFGDMATTVCHCPEVYLTADQPCLCLYVLRLFRNVERGNVFAMAPCQKLRVGDLAADADVFKSDFEMFSCSALSA